MKLASHPAVVLKCLQTVHAIEKMAITELPYLAGKCRSSTLVGSEDWELFASCTSTHRDDGLDVRVCLFEGCQCSETSLKSVDFLLQVCPFIKMLFRY